MHILPTKETLSKKVQPTYEKDSSFSESFSVINENEVKKGAKTQGAQGTG